MPNLDQPRGFECHGEVIRVRPYRSGSACYPGDLVSLASDGEVDPTATGAVILGVCLSYASASGVEVLVADHPDQLVCVQADETEVDAQTDVGNMCDITATAGSSTYKTSRQELDSSTIGTGAAQLQILGIERRVGDVLGTNVKCVCRINEHQLAQGSGVAGV